MSFFFILRNFACSHCDQRNRLIFVWNLYLLFQLCIRWKSSWWVALINGWCNIIENSSGPHYSLAARMQSWSGNSVRSYMRAWCSQLTFKRHPHIICNNLMAGWSLSMNLHTIVNCFFFLFFCVLSCVRHKIYEGNANYICCVRRCV